VGPALPRPGAERRENLTVLLKVLLFAQLGFVVNQIHFPWTTGIPGLAPVNILFLVTLIAMRGKPEPLAGVEPTLKAPLLWFYGALTFAFLWALVRGGGAFIDDATYYKNALFFPLFYFVYFKCRQDEKTTRLLIIWIMVVAAVAGLEAIKEGIYYGFDAYTPSKRASGPFGEDFRDSNRAGVFYAMFLPMFVAVMLFLRGKKLWRLASVGGVVLLAGGALFTYSRQAYLLVLLGLVVLLIRKSLILAVALSAVLVGLSGYLPDAVSQRVDETTQGSGTEGQLDASTASRWELWAGGMQMLRDHPLGVGLYRFPKESGNYTRYKNFDAHNFYVLTLAEAGPFGLVTLLLLMRAVFKLAKFVRTNAPPDDPETRALALGFTVTSVCMALGGIYGSPTLHGPVMSPYWALCGLLERYVHLKLQNRGQVIYEAEEVSLVERFPLAAHILPGGRG
jgi:hypothetical protein